jgi:putative ABC transport system permease protein
MRYRECLVRTALGASRARLLSQLLVENVLLFVLGGALGILLASWSVGSTVALAVAEGYVPARMTVSIDVRVLLFALSMSLGTGLIFGLAPAVRSARVDLNQGLRDASHGAGGGPGRGRSRRVLIVAELTLSLVLLIGFGLLIRSFLGLQSIGPGFDSTRLLEIASDGGRSFPEAVAYWQTALDRAGVMSGVESVAVTSRPPLRGARSQRFAVEGLNVAAADEPRAGDILVSAGYFKTLGIPVIAGRPFNERDSHGSTPVVVISQTLAARFFPDQNPLGRRLRLGERLPMTCCSSGAPVENVWREVVGVVGDIRQANLDEQPAATIYRPFTQIVEHDMFLMLKVRSDADLTRLAVSLPAALGAGSPGGQWSEGRPTAQVINASESVRLRRFVLILLGAFAGLALALAAVGLYGVMSYFVAERRREIAVRMALGATRSAVLAHVLSEAGRLVVAGLVLGGIAAHLLTRFISSLLFGVNANDAPTYIGVFGILGLVALLASYLPASRAAAIDPILALKEP